MSDCLHRQCTPWWLLYVTAVCYCTTVRLPLLASAENDECTRVEHDSPPVCRVIHGQLAVACGLLTFHSQRFGGVGKRWLRWEFWLEANAVDHPGPIQLWSPCPRRTRYSALEHCPTCQLAHLFVPWRQVHPKKLTATTLIRIFKTQVWGAPCNALMGINDTPGGQHCLCVTKQGPQDRSNTDGRGSTGSSWSIF